jgi:hypothetical protein
MIIGKDAQIELMTGQDAHIVLMTRQDFSLNSESDKTFDAIGELLVALWNLKPTLSLLTLTPKLIHVAEASITALSAASDSRITEIRPTSFSLYCTQTLWKDKP